MKVSSRNMGSRKSDHLAKISSVALVVFCLFQCSTKVGTPRQIEEENFGKTEDGTEVTLFTLTNKESMQVSITNYGCIITKILVPDKNGKMGDVVLGYDNLQDYIDNSPYFGSIVGRYGNRIAKGQFSLDGRTYELAVNNGPNHLHGGIIGFDKVVWDANSYEKGDSLILELTYLSKDGEEGYPGNLSVKVIYALTDDNSLRIDYEATTDKTTICNLTNHSYFNLKDAGASPILDHVLQINASNSTPVDSTLIPFGEIVPVKGTPFDFTKPEKIGSLIEWDDTQLRHGLGFDHNFALDEHTGEMRLAVTVTEPTTGRKLEIFTQEPGIQFYSGNFLDGSIMGKDGIVYGFRHAVVLEPQHFPDSPNQPQFPPTVLKPGEEYSTSSIYRFSTTQ